MAFSRSHVLSGLLFSVLLQYCVESQHDNLIEESPTIESLHARIGGGVELPCDMTPALPEDRMGLVIWYKQGHETPIYTLDIREGVTSHWCDNTLGVRATFRSDTRPAVLVLTKLRPDDSGQYRCRVDFIKSPTKNTRLNLTVLVPPERLIILNHEGNEVREGVLGPYDEGTEVNITCIAVGGRPTARVSWWKSHALLANSEARATVTFRLQRADFGSKVTCQAVTDPMIAPVSEIISIDVNLRLLWVRLQGGKRPLVAGQSNELVCEAVGARPKPNISWWKGGTRLKTAKETTSTDGNVTSSILTFMPSIEDAGRILSCRAVQPTLPHSTHEDGWKMEIQHLPVVKLELGANLDASKVVEGSDVYFDCRVRANPWHNHVYFTYNGEVVKPGPGVILANQSLVLQRVSRKVAGAYVCSAQNSLGEGSSENLILDVKFVPTCKSKQPVMMRAARGEVIDIKCDLDANPKESMSFHFWFNSSAHSKRELATSPIITANMPDTYVYMVNTSADYGWVQCYGTNTVGRQTKPCLFHILPADKPSTPKSCEITNITYDSISLNCSPGHDGGIRQSFLLEVFDMTTDLLLRNVSKDEPEFDVAGLSASNSLTLSVWAFNKRGFSEALTLTSSLLKYPQRHTAQMPVKVELTTILIIVLEAVVVIAAMTAVSAAVFCCKYWNKRDSKHVRDKKQQDESSNIPLTGTKEFASLSSLDTYVYMVNTSADYGWVQCYGTNTVGRQTKPCLFHILPADKPSTPKSCEITNITYDSISLNCSPGHDGGIRQSFLLEVFDMTTDLLLRNVSKDEPEFDVAGLSASNSLTLSVWAFNKRGFSEALTLTSSLLKYPQRHTAQMPVKVELTTILIIVLEAVVVIAAMTAVSAAVFCCKYWNKRDSKHVRDKKQQDESSNIPLTGTKEFASLSSLDKNPDIIPLHGEISDKCSNKSSTIDNSSIRPLVTRSTDNYDNISTYDRFYDHNVHPCNQYIQVRPLEYRRQYNPTLVKPNLGPHMADVGPNDCHKQYDNVHENWFKYKNALQLNTSDLLPAEPPELYAMPTLPSLYSNPIRNPLKLTQMPEMEPRSLLSDSRSCSHSPPIRFNTDNNGVYVSKSVLVSTTNTQPHLKHRIHSNSLTQQPEEPKPVSMSTRADTEQDKS